MGPSDGHDDADPQTGMPSEGQDDDHMDTKHQGESGHDDAKMEDTVQNAPGSTAGPVAQLKESAGELQGTPKGRMHTLVISA